MPLPFNKNLDLKLLKLVKENAILYNTRHAKYLDFDAREVIWQKIGDSLNRPALVCKSRWINIRDMMRRKFRERLKNPHAHSYKYKYEEELSFMMPYFKEPVSSGSTADEYTGFLEDDACEVEMPSEVFVDEALDFEEPRETKPVFRKRQCQEDGNSSRDFSEPMFQELSPTDPLDVFLLTIGSTLRKFSPYYLNQAKSKIFQVVQDYELQQIVNKDAQTPGSSDAVNFAGLQCQIQLGDFQENKHKPGFIEKLEEYLPTQYSNAWNVEKKILKEYGTHQGQSELEAKFLYIKTARALPTYGVTFFLVKEKQKDKKKLVPRLLGINAEAILRLDEVTKEILQQWPLTHVKTYHAGKSQTFTLNFGDYSDKEYSVKTQDCHRIRDILEGYIDIIRRRMLARPYADSGESMTICHDNVQMGKSHLIEHVSHNSSKMVTESFVGPTKLVPFDQGSHAHSGAMITTVQQIVVTDHLQKQQQAFKGEMPIRSDMSQDCVRKLNRMNSNSVKIVGLLTDPTEDHVKDAQQILRDMQEDLPVVEQGVKETADKQSIDDAKKMLLDELQDLNNYMNKLADSIETGKVNPSDAKDAAECIADLTTQMYFSTSPKAKIVNELLRRSRKSFKDGEKTEQTIRRASFVAAATTALHSVDTAAQALHEEYTGPKLDEEQQRKLEKALEHKMGKLNAAIALYLTAHSDPENIDYSAAINSMNTINELMPKLARDAQILASTKDPAARKELQNEMRALFDATKKVCGLSGNEDHEKMQEATNQYADVAGKLIFKFARGTNADKENEIVQLAKDAGTKVSQLLVAANELTCQAASSPAAAHVDEAGVRTVGAARDLLHSAQLTAPAMHEPHCQSALTAAACSLASAVQRLQASCRPLLEDPTRQHMADLLHTRANEVTKALDRLRDAYGNLEGDDRADTSLPLQEKKRLKFITTLSGAKNKLRGVQLDEWDKPATGAGAPSEQEKATAQRRLEQKMAQLNAAIAALAAATADRENPDYDTAELAMSTITDLLPQIAKDTEVVGSDKDEATRSAMHRNLAALCDAVRHMCDGDGYQHVQGEALDSYAAASGKLVFLVSPGADKGKQKYIMDLSSAAHAQAAELAAQAQRVEQLAGRAGQLGRCAHQPRDDAQALLSVAQVTAASIGEERCRDALSSAVGKLQGSADQLATSCQQAAPQHCAALQDSHNQLTDSLSKLAHICGDGQDDSASLPSAQQEKQRLKFVQSLPGAKRRLDAAAQHLTKPMACHMMMEEDAAVLEQQLRDRLAQLNAALAALAAATADRENPDYEAAEQAVNTITTLMPRVVQDSRKLCGTKNDAGQAAMLQDIRALCDASQEICDNAGEPQGLGDAAAKFTAASRNLGYHVTPESDDDKENEVVGLSAVACGKASELLSQVQRLTELLADAQAAAELDSRGARAADAAQALLSVAQATGPTISDAYCQKELISAAEKLRGTTADLTSSCQPHLEQRPEMKQQVLSSQHQLQDSLDKLIEACKSAQDDTSLQSSVSPAEKEKRRLKFINSLTGAKNRLYDSEQQLKQPMTKQPLKPEEAAALQQRLSQRLAQLNAAIAALATANADAENPNYAAAEKAVKEISDLMPLIVQDSRKLSSTKDDAGQAAMLEELKALCQASRSICENTETSPKVNATDFNKAASKLVFLVSPAADKAKEKQVTELSAAACAQAQRHVSELLGVAPQLLGVAPQLPAAARLGPAGARLRSAANALHAVTQATSPSISEPLCSTALVSAAENLRSAASDLTATGMPHVQHLPEMKQQVLSSQRQVDDSVDKLVKACKPGHSGNLVGVPSAQQQEKEHLQFISSVSGAKDRLDAAEQQLKEPLLCQMMRQEDAAAVQRGLAARLAQLNAAIAALAAATADRENPDYAAADRAVRTITELMPQVVQDSRTLCGTKTDKEQAAMLQDLQALCDASREICDSAGKPQGLSDAAAKFSAASGKLVFIVSPKAQDAQEKQVLALSTASCVTAGELLSHVQQLTEMIPQPDAAAELDSRGARAADAAQALLTVALATAPTISDPHCQKELISAAEKLCGTTSDLTSSCQPHLEQRPEMKQQVLSSQHQLQDSLDKLIEACNTMQHGNMEASPSAQQEKQRLKFISSVSGAKGHLAAAEQQLREPFVLQTTQQDPATLQRKLRARLAQLNAAVAALAAATADRENPDYDAAHRAVETIPKLLQEVIHDSRALSATKDGPGAAAMPEHLRALGDATRQICENVEQLEGVGEAAARFSAASGKMIVVAGPITHSAQEKQVIDLTTASCGKASELLSQVQRLTELLADAQAAAELDSRGARAADAAQGLLTVAQITASSISEPVCSAQLVSAAEKLRSTASDLTSSCGPHLEQQPEMKQQVLSSQRQLADSLDNLIQACKAAQHGMDVALSPQQEKQRVKFVSSVSGAKKHLDSAEQQMNKPVLSHKLPGAAGASLQQQLARRLAQLNAAVAALAAATQDGKNPDYPAAERAVITITELMPQVVQDSHSLCGSKDEAEQAAMLRHLRDLCDASRAICDSAGQPIKLHEASAKLAHASGKLVFIVGPEGLQGSKPAVPVRKPAPPTPVRDPKHIVTQAVRSTAHADATQTFLDTLRGEESQNKAKIVGTDAKTLQALEDEKRAYKQFLEMIDSAEKGLKTAEDGVKAMCTTTDSPRDAWRREQRVEGALARAGGHVAALVAAHYGDKLDYKAAMDPIVSLTESVKSIINDGSVVCSSLPEHARKPFLEDMTKLCQATKSITDAAKSKENVKKLNDAAISFGDQSAKLLKVVSCKVDPALEKEVISRAKAIGDTASRLALEASSVASDASNSADAHAHVQHICSAGASCVDAAGKLVYTAKLIAPTIHHAICQDTLVSSADNLSTSLTKFSKTWAPLASAHQPTVHKLTQEAAHLEDLVEKLRRDVKAGKFGQRNEVEQIVNLDSPLRRMTMQIIDTAKSMAEYGELTTEQKKEYISYSNSLEEAIRVLDLANARHQRAPHDKSKRDEMEIAIQDLQMTLLQTRPSRAGQEQNNIVDFRDFLQDLVKEAGELQSIAKKNEGPAGKRTTDDIKLLSSKISEDASRLLNPPDNFGDGVTVMSTVDDIMDIDMFGQECDVLVKEINGAIQAIHDQKAKQALRAKALPLTESCHLLRFATTSHIMATKSAAVDEALQNLDNFKTTVMPPLAKEAARKSQKEKKAYSSPLGSASRSRRAAAGLLRARTRALLGDPEPLYRAVTYYAAASVAEPDYPMVELQAAVEVPLVAHEDRYLETMQNMVSMTNDITRACLMPQTLAIEDEIRINDHQAHISLKKLYDLDYAIASRKIKTSVLNAEDIDKLLLCKRQPVDGTPKQLEDKLQQLSTKLSSMAGTVVLSVKKPESVARSLHASADVAAQLANTARALQDTKRPVQCKKIEEAAHEMCLATYSLLKTAELVCQDPNHHDSRRKLTEACRHLNDSINKLVRSVGGAGGAAQQCGEQLRALQLQRGVLQGGGLQGGGPQGGGPPGAAPYAHCLDTLADQRDVLQKLNSEQAMSREEFLKSMNYVATAVSNSTECAAQAAYLISVSEKDESIGKEGIIDVAKLHKAVGAIEEACVSIIMTNDEEQVKEETDILKVQVHDLLHGMDDGIKKTKEGELKEMLMQCRSDINLSSMDLFQYVKGNANDKEKIISKVMDLMDDVNHVNNLIEHPDLVPTAGDVSADTQKHVDEVVKSSLALLTNTEELIKQVKASPEKQEVMKWVMFNKRKDVLDAFENLLKAMKTSGQRSKLVEGSTEDSEGEKKSYVQKQFDAASKWLLKPMSKAEVKTSGQQAVRNLLEVANNITEDLKGSDKDDMRTLVTETEQLLTECTKKYDHEQYSVLMERVRELKKSIERGVVTRVVQDFMEAEAPLADLDLVADYEKDESKRKFLLEKKIAELLAQLSRVTSTARLIAHTDRDAGAAASTQLNSCSEQAELLAPMLVKAAQQRVASPDDKVVIENYKSLLARYAESLSKIRDLCDQSVDPMAFVQTAGETMERMREESTKRNDPVQCAHTSAAITKLANRVIHVGMSSSTARSDPEAQKALTEAQKQLTAATPPADTRASKMPDWKDTTAKILQATEEVESLLCGEAIFKTQPGPNQPIYNEALNLHVAIRDWSSRDNEIVAVAKRMAVLMAKLSNYMNNDKQREVLSTSKSIVMESHEVARLAKKLAHECTDHRIKTNLLQTCERIPTISGQLKMLTTVKGFSLGRHGTQEDKEALDMLVGNAQSLMLSIQDVVKGAASASVKIMSQRGPRMKWVRKTVY